ncbi:MAG: leucyl aminopeptidase [Alphaproteobacteria bacterium]|jgi:leucyl aminopeptidase
MTLTALAARADKATVPLSAVPQAGYGKWLAAQPARVQAWLAASGFEARAGEVSLLAGADGGLEHVFIGIPVSNNASTQVDDGAVWAFAACPGMLPQGSYALGPRVSANLANQAALGWALGSYRFTRYQKAPVKPAAQLVWPDRADRPAVENAALATFLVRDLINTPAGDMGPPELAAAAKALARTFGARVRVITGDDLLAKNFPAIHAVGRASDKPPRLIDLTWTPKPAASKKAQAKLKRVTICGKGVCFDTGGLDLKSAGGMLNMKKDMGGAAQALGLARMVMGAKLPVQLRVLIPAVENAVAGNAYHPRDVIKTRAGITVEVGNTDAEGRIVLADALAEAMRAGCDLLIDLATLTGAARVALGTGLPAMFCNNDAWAARVLAAGRGAGDPLWQLPLWRPYRDMLESKVADINNISSGPFAGAITAALFLQEFVAPDVPWIHVDFMGWNTASRPGRPEGGEAQGMRALYQMIARHLVI